MHLKNSEKARVTIEKEANRKSREGVKVKATGASNLAEPCG